MRVDRILEITPGDSGLHANDATRRVDLQHAVHAAHIQMQRIRGCDLASHAVAAAADGYRTRPATDRVTHLLGGDRTPLDSDGHGVETREVVYHPPLRRGPGHGPRSEQEGCGTAFEYLPTIHIYGPVNGPTYVDHRSGAGASATRCKFPARLTSGADRAHA